MKEEGRRTEGRRWQYDDPLLAWLLVGAYGAHVIEEWVGGFPEWVGLAAGRPLPRGGFVAINAVAMAVMVAAVRAATRRPPLAWIVIAVAALLFVNGLLHALASGVTGTYSPGLLTGVVLYFPMAGLALLRAAHQAPAAFLWRGWLTAIAVHALVSAIAFALARAS